MLHFVRPLCHDSQNAADHRGGGETAVSAHLLASGSCKAGSSVLRAPELEGSKAIVFHPIFHFRSCLKRLLQPCGCIEMLCISAAPAGADPAGYGRMAHCTEGSGQGAASSHPASHDQRCPLLSCSVFRLSAAHPGYFSGCAAFYRSACCRFVKHIVQRTR